MVACIRVVSPEARGEDCIPLDIGNLSAGQRFERRYPLNPSVLADQPLAVGTPPFGEGMSSGSG